MYFRLTKSLFYEPMSQAFTDKYLTLLFETTQNRLKNGLILNSIAIKLALLSVKIAHIVPQACNHIKNA